MQIKDRKKRYFALLLNIFLYLITLPFRLFSSSPKGITDSPKSFLIIRLDHIGDVVLSTPVYHALKSKFPKSEITVLCGSWGKPVLENNPYVDSVRVLDCPWWASIRNDATRKESFLKQLIHTLRYIHSKKFDVFIELRGDIRHIFLFGWLPNIPYRIAYTRSGGDYLLSHPVEYPAGKHEIERNNLLLSFFDPIKKFWKTELYTNSSIDNNLKNKLAQHLNVDSEPYVVIFNGGRSNLRRLNHKKVAQLCTFLIQTHDIKCCFVGQKTDFNTGEEIRNMIGIKKDNFVNICGELTLPEIRTLINQALIFYGTDSSITHISASTNTPSITFFGPLNPEETMPLGKNKHVIYHKYPCSPCLQHVCVVTRSTNVAQCIEDITIEEITSQTNKILGDIEAKKMLL